MQVASAFVSHTLAGCHDSHYLCDSTLNYKLSMGVLRLERHDSSSFVGWKCSKYSQTVRKLYCRYHSPVRYPSQSPSSSAGRDSFSPFSLRKPVDRRREAPQKPNEPQAVIRKEGFETRQDALQTAHPISLSSSTSSGLSSSPPTTPDPRLPSAKSRADVPSTEQDQPKAAEKRTESLLSRTLSSRASNPEALKVCPSTPGLLTTIST